MKIEMENKCYMDNMWTTNTTYGDDICRGCRRFRHEITSWINYSDSEKNIINR